MRMILRQSVNELSMEDLMWVSGSLSMIQGQYESRKMTLPEGVQNRINDVESEIKFRARTELRLRLKRAEAMRESLKTPGEKRKELDQEIADLEAALK